MILIILCFIFAVLAFLMANYFDKNLMETPEACSIIFGTILSIAFFVMTMLSATKNSDAKYLCAERDFYENLIESVSDGATLETVNKIVAKSNDINEQILKHRKYCDSAFIGCLYSKDIANADLIEIPTLYLTNFKTE